jgi:hypothetical protein
MSSPNRAAAAERPTPPMEKLAFTIAEAAQVSSLGQTSIYKAIREKKLRCRKYGTRSIITRPDLTSFLDGLPDENEKAREKPSGLMAETTTETVTRPS